MQNLSPGPSGLMPGTAYYVHFMHRDAAGNRSTPVTSSSFTTSAGTWAGTLDGTTIAVTEHPAVPATPTGTLDGGFINVTG